VTLSVYRQPGFNACVVCLVNSLFNRLISVHLERLPSSSMFMRRILPDGLPITTALQDRSLATLVALCRLSCSGGALLLERWPNNSFGMTCIFLKRSSTIVSSRVSPNRMPAVMAVALCAPTLRVSTPPMPVAPAASRKPRL